MNDIKRIQQIENYLHGEMEGETLREFEELLLQDESLVEEMENYKKAVEGIRINSRDELKDRLKSIHDEVIGAQYSRRMYAMKALRVAAVIFGVLILAVPSYYFYHQNNLNQSERLFAENFSPYMNITTQRGLDENKENILEKAAMYYYNNKEFEKAIINFEEILKTKNKFDPTILFYYGITCLAANQNEKSIGIFSKLATDKNYLLWEQSQWYLALAYVKANNLNKARETLNLIAKENGQFSIKAINLLYELK
jgi:tetratricopeptide (TPR) repeat protein